MTTSLKELAKKAVFRYTRFGAPQYSYNIEPIQLATLVIELDKVKEIPGVILEVGVARGMTTRFLCEHLMRSQRTGERICVVDTFESFTARDIEYEVERRGKIKGELIGFSYNDFGRWKENFREFPFVTAFASDCSTFDYSQISPIKLAFLDVDLYLPTKQALDRIYTQLCKGGVILVDDVKPNNNCDGAYDAYIEFCSERGLATEFVGTKCGLIRKVPS